MDQVKLKFLKEEFISLIGKIDPQGKPKWGVMNAQQMIEHLSDSVRIANGKDIKKILTPAENLPRAKAFMMSDKPFKENTKNVELPEVPPPVRKSGMNLAIEELQGELKDFFSVFENEPGKSIANPFYGDLNYAEWVQLLHKHFTHHLRQFNIIN